MQLTTLWVLCLTVSTYAELSPDFSAQVLSKAVELNWREDNVVVSPYSLLGPLGALVLGSGYSTRREILDALGLANKSEVLALYEDYQEKLDGVALKTSNKIYIALNEEINHRFNSVAKKYFDLEVENIDFNQTEEADQEIAKWVKTNSNYTVTEGIKTHPELKAVLLNTVYLKSPWYLAFSHAGVHNFYVNSLKHVNASYMNSLAYYFYAHSEELDAEVLSVPLQAQCDFVVVLPKFPTYIQNVVKALKADANLVNNVLKNSSLEFTNVTLPMFNVETSTDLKLVLQELNISRIFEDDAQIRRLLKNNSELHLNEASQKVSLYVGIEGITAGASNAVDVEPTVETLSAGVFPPKIVQFNVQYPFYYEVKCSNIVLFSGITTLPDAMLKHTKKARA